MGLDTVKWISPKNLFYSLVLFSIIIYSCEGSSRENSDDGTYTLRINTDRNAIFKWPKSLVSEGIIYLETLDSALISHVEKMWVSNDGLNNLFIFDSRQKKIFIFNSSGKIISVFDKNGSGPEEYNEIRDVFIDFKSKEIHILANRQIKKYHLKDFRYLGNKDLRNVSGDVNFTRFIKINEVYYLWTNIPPFQRPDITLKNQKQQFHLVRLGEGTEQFFVEYKYCVLNEIRFYPSITDDIFYLSPITGKNNVQFVTEKGVFSKYDFPFSAKAVPDDLLREMFHLENEFLTSDYFKLLTNLRETNRFLYFNYIGPEAKVFHGLFNKTTLKIESVGRNEQYIPQLVYYDGTYFYSFISPDVLFNLIANDRINLSNNTLLGHVDLEKIKKDDNPLIVKFSIE